jgi:hypothetical protein
MTKKIFGMKYLERTDINKSGSFAVDNLQSKLCISTSSYKRFDHATKIDGSVDI